jgi:hypothetical protein
MVAALSLFDGRAVADPFEPTADVVAMLRLRAGHTRSTSRLRPAFAGVLRPALR